MDNLIRQSTGAERIRWLLRTGQTFDYPVPLGPPETAPCAQEGCERTTYLTDCHYCVIHSGTANNAVAERGYRVRKLYRTDSPGERFAIGTTMPCTCCHG